MKALLSPHRWAWRPPHGRVACACGRRASAVGRPPVPILGWRCPAQARRARWGAHGHSDPSRSAFCWARVRVDGEGSRRAQRPVACPGASVCKGRSALPTTLLRACLPTGFPHGSPFRRTLACQHWGHVSLSPPMPSRGRCVADGRATPPGDLPWRRRTRRALLASHPRSCNQGVRSVLLSVCHTGAARGASLHREPPHMTEPPEVKTPGFPQKGPQTSSARQKVQGRPNSVRRIDPAGHSHMLRIP
jgi:hypothetical protein